jgi:signal transduction histidine kinase
MSSPSEKTHEEIQQKLIEQYTEIAQLAGGLAHEIKNPLSTIRLNMELLAEEFESPETPKERRSLRKIQVMQQECARLDELLNDFLNFARAHKHQLEPTDPNGILREVLDFFRPQAEENGIEVIEFFASDLPSVLLDRKSFHRALLNLVLNAQQAMPDGGELAVRTRLAKDWVAIDLIDTGEGIDPKVQEHIFDPFFSTKQGGSGLGLPTVRKIIEAHGGRILLQSEPGQGTQFTLVLPSLARLAGETSEASETPEPPETSE